MSCSIQGVGVGCGVGGGETLVDRVVHGRPAHPVASWPSPRGIPGR